MTVLVAALEAGGTKFVPGLVEGSDDGSIPTIVARGRIPTGDPRSTVDAVAAWFASAVSKHGQPSALGIASFGPLAGRFGEPGWGGIGPTPKPGWAGFGLASELGARLGLTASVDTDVNAAALAEGRWGAAQGLSDYVYVTVGTGIGAGIVANGSLLHGAAHPEAGHVPVPRAEGDPFRGGCPFHRTCLEGMASGPALADRWGAAAETLPLDHPAWELEAHYLAWGFVPLVHVLATERIILGGGLGSAPGLAAKVRAKLSEALGGYAPRLDRPGAMDSFIVLPGLGGASGLLGAAALALFEAK